MSITRYHMTIDLLWVLRQADERLTGLFRHQAEGRTLSPEEARALCVEMLRQGFDVLPMCDAHDSTGRCQVHTEAENAPVPDLTMGERP
jgi:hypothetical protein